LVLFCCPAKYSLPLAIHAEEYFSGRMKENHPLEILKLFSHSYSRYSGEK
jgi:hypothetical protein